jgi:hypothetical protein
MPSTDPLKDLLGLVRRAAREGVVGPAASRCQHVPPPAGATSARRPGARAKIRPCARAAPGKEAGLAWHPSHDLSSAFAKSTNATT